MKKVIISLALFSVSGFAQQEGTLTDPRDKKTYKTVKIGEQVWTAQNLDYRGSDGYLGVCYGDLPRKEIKNPKKKKKYGRLYNWEEVMEVCPAGWHLPSDAEWQTLVDFAGGGNVAEEKLKAKSGWNNCLSVIDELIFKCNNSNGTDKFGFSALPGGFSDGNLIGSGDFNGEGDFGGWWSATEYNSSNAYNRSMLYYGTNISRGYTSKLYLYSVRCLQNKGESK
jgi:uncharacterized protein (TIGR02145 family)